MALSEIRVGQSESIPLAVIRRQARAPELAKVVPELCGVVWSSVRARGMKGGRHVAVFSNGTIRVSTETSPSKVEVGVEMFDSISDEGEVIRSATPAGRTASVTHLGPYQQLGTAHRAILDWCATHHLQLAGQSWEIYGHWEDGWNADPSKIRTDVFYQLAAVDC
jgi:effector-binding domain-containing protein